MTWPWDRGRAGSKYRTLIFFTINGLCCRRAHPYFTNTSYCRRHLGSNPCPTFEQKKKLQKPICHWYNCLCSRNKARPLVRRNHKVPCDTTRRIPLWLCQFSRFDPLSCNILPVIFAFQFGIYFVGILPTTRPETRRFGFRLLDRKRLVVFRGFVK